jgi:hypothetical protein
MPRWAMFTFWMLIAIGQTMRPLKSPSALLKEWREGDDRDGVLVQASAILILPLAIWQLLTIWSGTR